MFLDWVKKCRDDGITCPILPGLLPIQNYGGFKRMTQLCKTIVPPELEAALEPIKDDDEAVKALGVQVTVDMCKKMLDAGLKGFHFYTLNLEKSVRLVLEKLNFVAPSDQVKPLPWAPVGLVLDTDPLLFRPSNTELARSNAVSQTAARRRNRAPDFLGKPHAHVHSSNRRLGRLPERPLGRL